MSDDSNTISFFFNARGGSLEKSTQGMYRSLLLQLLKKLPDSRKEQVLEDYALLAGVGQSSIKWDNGVLQHLLSKAISLFGETELICFVDALDECYEDDVYEMIEYFEALGKLASEATVKLLICLSTRHYPSITVKDGIALTLEDQGGHSRDLEQYVTHKLEVGGKNAPGIRDTLLRKASGVFMWVVLVVNILNKEHQRGRIFAVKKRLDEIPSELGELFKNMLKRDGENMNEFKLSIQWILYAKRPLQALEYYCAMLSGLDHEQGYLNEWDGEAITQENVEQYVLSSSKGLAEVAKTYNNVQFIHESVRDFILDGANIHEIWPDLPVDFQSYSHDQLKQCCYNYIKSMALHADSDGISDDRQRQVGSPWSPFTSFAVTNVAYHSRYAAAGSSQHCFLETFDFQTWIRLYGLANPFLEAAMCDDLVYLLTSQSPAGCCNTDVPPTSTRDHHKKVIKTLYCLPRITARQQPMLFAFRKPSFRC